MARKTPAATEITTANDLYHHLWDRCGPCGHQIKVTVGPDGKKIPTGEKNNLTQEELRHHEGVHKGMTWSFALRHMPGIAVLDFDQKDGLDSCALWQLCVERDYLRCETNHGHHVWVSGCEVPLETKEVNVHADIKLDVIAHQRNVWEPRKRAFIGTLQDLAWSELLPHLDATKLSGARLKKTPQEFAEGLLRPVENLPPEIAAWITAHWTPRSVSHDVQTRQKKRRCGEKTIVTEQQVALTTIRTTDGAEILMERGDDGETKRVEVRQTDTGEAELRELLQLVSSDVSRDDWLRVGSYLKHQTACDGWPLWRDWSQQSKQCSSKLLYEWQNLGGGNECSLGTLIYLARQSNAKQFYWERKLNQY
jgi:hypothetical protein